MFVSKTTGAPLANQPKDANFNNTVLLLHGDGTNGANNSVFLDSSTNAYTTTKTGAPSQGTFSPFSTTRWSNQFNGTTDRLTVATSTEFNIGSNDFTIEGWIYPTSVAATALVIERRISGGFVAGDWGLYILSTALVFFAYDYNAAGNAVLTSGAITPNVWTHFALVRNGSTTSLYINGVSAASTTAVTISTNTSAITIGADIGSGTRWFFPGYISNLRFVRGTAVYTGNFSTPTSELTAITDTKLLTCQSIRFKDNSVNDFTVTPSGTPSIQPFSPLAPTGPYSNTVVGGSIRFNGSTDYLSSTITSTTIGTGDFTVECWVYPTAAYGATSRMFFFGPAGAATGYLNFFINTSGQVVYGPSGTALLTTTGTVPLNVWTHIAISRTSATSNVYINGVSSASSDADTTNFLGTTNLFLGKDGSTNYFNGYISNFRLVNGVGIYTSDFTLPTAPVKYTANTILLIDFTNAGIIDNTQKNNLITVGSTALSSTVNKFGRTSMLFNGTTDYATIPNSDLFNLTTGDFTIEAWIYPTVLGGENGIYCKREVSTFIGVVFRVLNTTRKLVMQIANAAGTAWAIDTSDSGLPALTINAWYHVALVRSGSSFQIFQNGVAGTASTFAGNITHNTAPTYIGKSDGSAGNQFWNGYIDELRVTRGVARYTSTFTPRTGRFPDR